MQSRLRDKPAGRGAGMRRVNLATPTNQDKKCRFHNYVKRPFACDTARRLRAALTVAAMHQAVHDHADDQGL